MQPATTPGLGGSRHWTRPDRSADGYAYAPTSRCPFDPTGPAGRTVSIFQLRHSDIIADVGGGGSRGVRARSRHRWEFRTRTTLIGARQSGTIGLIAVIHHNNQLGEILDYNAYDKPPDGKNTHSIQQRSNQIVAAGFGVTALDRRASGARYTSSSRTIRKAATCRPDGRHHAWLSADLDWSSFRWTGSTRRQSMLYRESPALRNPLDLRTICACSSISTLARSGQRHGPMAVSLDRPATAALTRIPSPASCAEHERPRCEGGALQRRAEDEPPHRHAPDRPARIVFDVTTRRTPTTTPTASTHAAGSTVNATSPQSARGDLSIAE